MEENGGTRQHTVHNTQRTAHSLSLCLCLCVCVCVCLSLSLSLSLCLSLPLLVLVCCEVYLHGLNIEDDPHTKGHNDDTADSGPAPRRAFHTKLEGEHHSEAHTQGNQREIAEVQIPAKRTTREDDMRRGHAKRTCEEDMRRRHAKRTCEEDMRRRHAKTTCEEERREEKKSTHT